MSVTNETKGEGEKLSRYAIAILGLVTLIRCCYIVQKDCLGYAFGYEGRDFRQNNPKYMIRASFPELVPVFGLVASGLVGPSYACANVFMSAKSKNWNKKLMLCVALVGMCLTMFGHGLSQTLGFFALNRFLFGCFSSAINVPIY